MKNRFEPAPGSRTGAVSRLAAGALSLVVASTLASGQSSLAGSESGVDLARSTLSGVGRAASGSFTAEVAVGAAVAGAVAKSESFTAVAGTVAVDGPLPPGPPILFGAASEPDGSAVLIGYHFGAPGSGSTAVLFGGSLAGDVQVTANTTIAVTPPPTSNPFGNPPGCVDVELVNQLGGTRLPDAYTYLPALVQEAPAHVGGSLDMSYRGMTGSFAVLAMGTPFPGVAVPLSPFAGALELVSGLALLSPLVPAPSGAILYSFALPDKPALAGLALSFQAVSITSLAPLSGSFTNVLSVPVDA